MPTKSSVPKDSDKHPQGPKARQLAIAEAVVRNGITSVEELVSVTGVSAMTIYRDLASLEERGVLQRHRGQVVAVASGLHEADAEFRLEQSSPEKQWVAAEGGRLVTSGSSIMLDDSTSCVCLLRSLPDLASLTVVTNSLLVANEVKDYHSTKLIMTGGEYQPWAHALMGPMVIKNIRSLHADFCFLSASGISGLSCFHPRREVAEVKEVMLESAEVKVLLLDHTKFNRRALFKFADLRDFTHVVIDEDTPAPLVASLHESGVPVTIARRPRDSGAPESHV